MSDEASDKRGITLMLLQESLWKVEEKLCQVIEDIAAHEAELMRLRRLITLTSEHLHNLETSSKKTKSKKPKHDRRNPANPI